MVTCLRDAVLRWYRRRTAPHRHHHRATPAGAAAAGWAAAKAARRLGDSLRGREREAAGARGGSRAARARARACARVHGDLCRCENGEPHNHHKNVAGFFMGMMKG